MSNIENAQLWLVDLQPATKRTDAVQSFVSQETVIVQLTDSDGATGTGYSYTIGTGGSAVCAMLRDHLLPALAGLNSDMIEQIWLHLKRSTNATAPGAITSLALAAIDTALWDLRCRKANLPLHIVAGGAKSKAPAYSTEGGWLHLDEKELVDDAVKVQEAGMQGSKIKIGRPSVAEDGRRLAAVRKAVGDDFMLMVDANCAFNLAEAQRRCRVLEESAIAWFEEPIAPEDIEGHCRLAQLTQVPIAVGETLYSTGQFEAYISRRAASVIQVDVARIGGITAWLKVAHAAECANLEVAPHFLMELHVSLVCAVANGRWVEHIPQLDPITSSSLKIEQGMAHAPEAAGLGIDWDWEAINAQAEPEIKAVRVG